MVNPRDIAGEREEEEVRNSFSVSSMVHATVQFVVSRADIMEADDRQVTTAFKSNRHSTIGTRQTEYYEALPSSANDEVMCDCTFADDGNAS